MKFTKFAVREKARSINDPGLIDPDDEKEPRARPADSQHARTPGV
jgi:hypothetical protein